MKRSEVIVVGAGPAGIVAAIAARRRGLEATVLDARIPPIDKPCGEGILPQGVAALAALGISLPVEHSLPFRGIQFFDGDNCARAEFAGAKGISMRRVKLHPFLVEQAADAGVKFRWGARVMGIEKDRVITAADTFSYEWLVGADGWNSQVRKWAGLDARKARTKRFGFCSHFRLKPWTNVAEVHWAAGCQIFITPMVGEEVGVAVISGDSGLRLENALPRFPAVAEKLRGAERTTREFGDTTSLNILPRVTHGRIALIGDASGSVDAVTGHGLSLSFQQAIPLAEAMKIGDLEAYGRAHKKISAVPVLMTRLMVLMGKSNWIRGRTMRLFQSSPALFARMLAIHSEAAPLSSVRLTELAGLGWKFLRA